MTVVIASFWRDIVVAMLLCNALWDALCGAAIVVYMQCGWLKNLAGTHLGLWVADDDQLNPAAMVLMSVLLFQWSFTRGYAAMDFDMHWADAAYSYWLEGALIGTCALAGTMHLGRGVCVILLCFCCWEAVVVTGMGEI